VGEITYADVWDNNFFMKFDSKACKDCEECKTIDYCPTNAFIIKDGVISAIDRSRCFNCGTCVRLCPDAFKLDLKSIEFVGAIKLAEELKQMILKGEFLLKKPTGTLDFAESIK
jgi:ferredoxin